MELCAWHESLCWSGHSLLQAAPQQDSRVHGGHLPISSRKEKNSSSLWPLLVTKPQRVVIISVDWSRKDTDMEE